MSVNLEKRNSASYSYEEVEATQEAPPAQMNNPKFTMSDQRGAQPNIDPDVLVYKKWHKFPIGKQFAIQAVFAGVMGSFLFGMSMGLFNASGAWVGAELFSCNAPNWTLSPMDNGSGVALPTPAYDWMRTSIPDTCQHLMVMKYDDAMDAKQTEQSQAYDLVTWCTGDKDDDTLKKNGCWPNHNWMADKKHNPSGTFTKHQKYTSRYLKLADGSPVTFDMGLKDDKCVAPTQSSCQYVRWMNAILSISILLGAFLACMVGGVLLKMGLHQINACAMVIFVVGSACTASAGSLASVCVARFVTGFAVGMTSIYPPMWIAQMTPITQKGAYGVAHQLFITIGILIGVLVGLGFGGSPNLSSLYFHPLVGQRQNYSNGNPIFFDADIGGFQKGYWRCLVSIGYIIPIFFNLVIFGYMSMKTPMEYVEMGHLADAKEGLKRIYKKEKTEDIQEYYDMILNSMDEREEALKSGLTLGIALKIKDYRNMIMIGCMGSAIQQLSGINVFILASNQIFAQSGVSPASVTIVSIIMTALNCVMTFPAIPLIEKLGRKTLMLVGICGQTVGALLPTIGMWSAPNEKWGQYISIAGVFILVCSFSTAMGPVLWVWFTEIFPADVNHAASSVLVASNWLAGIGMVFLGTGVTDNRILFIVFLALNVYCFVFMFFFCKETKGLPTGVSPYLTQEQIEKAQKQAKELAASG